MRRRSIAIASSSWSSNLNYYVLLFENGTSTKMCNYLLVEYLESLLFQTSPWAQLLYTFIFIQTYHLYTHLHTHAHHTNRWMARIKSLFQGVMCAIVIYCKLLVLLCRRIFLFRIVIVLWKDKQTCTVTPDIATHGEMWEKRGSPGWCVRMGVYEGKKGCWEEVRGGDGF